VVGHLACSKSLVINGFMLGEESHPLSEWDGMFGAGNEPAANAAGEQPVEEWRSDQPLNIRGSEAPRVFKPPGLHASA